MFQNSKLFSGVEGLLAPAPVVASVPPEEPVTTFGQRDGAVPAVQLHGLNQSLIPEMAKIGIARIVLIVPTL